MDNLKLLSSMKDSRGASGAHMDAGEPYGVLTWLLAMVCSFVAAGTLVSKTTLGPADNSGAAHNAFQLKADGSCRFGHVCDHWDLGQRQGAGGQVPRFGGY